MAKPRRKKPKYTRASLRERQRRKKKRWAITGGIAMARLMVLSIVGIINVDPTATGQQLEYGPYEFRVETRANGGTVLVTEINGVSVEFQNLPTQVGYLDMDPSITPTLQNAQQIGLVSSPNLSEYDAGNVDYARLQFALAFQKTVNGMSGPGEHSQTILTCDRATRQFPLVFFNITNQTTRLSADENCITLTGKDQDLMRLKDRLIFEYYGILQNGEVVDA